MNKCLVSAYLCMAMLFFPSSSAMASKPGDGYFKNSYIDDITYHISNGRVMIDSITWWGLPVDPYPCEAAILKMNLVPSTVQKCYLVRNITEQNEIIEYTNMRTLTNSEMVRFFNQTGDVGPAGNDPLFSYKLGFMGTFGSTSSGIPADRKPPKPPEPPEPALSCSVSGSNINYDTLAESDVEGKKAKANVYIYCNKKANVRLAAKQYNHTTGIAMGSNGALAATLTISGISAATGKSLTIPSYTSTPVTIEATLRKRQTAIPSGTYKGMIVLTLSTD